MQAKEFKIMVLGPRSGKTTFVRKLTQQNCKFTPSTTVGVQVTPTPTLYANRPYRLIFWEVGSQFPGLGKGYGAGMDGAIIFMDDDENACRSFQTWVPAHVPTIYTRKGCNEQHVLRQLQQLLFLSKCKL